MLTQFRQNLWEHIVFTAMLARHYRTYVRFKRFTMLPLKTYVLTMLLTERARHLDGIVVECGVWRGGVIAGMATVLGDDREYVLFDSFEGLPPAKEIDGKSAIEWQKATDSPDYHDNCRAEETFAREAMALASVHKVSLIKGWFSDTLPKYESEAKIAILRIDADWYDSTMECLDALYQRVVVGGIIFIDDYYTWDGCAKAVHDFLSKRKLSDRLEQLGGRVCYIVKRE